MKTEDCKKYVFLLIGRNDKLEVIGTRIEEKEDKYVVWQDREIVATIFKPIQVFFIGVLNEE